MTTGADTIARELLESARLLIDRHSADTRGLWPRAAVLLIRQALEVAVKTYWSAKAPGTEECSCRAQLLCLGPYIGDEALARRASQAWSELSGAAHVHPYELPPTREEIVGWIERVRDVVDVTERG
jgi:hypothetical protein